MPGGDDHYLTSITAGVAFVTGTNQVTMSVHADAGGLPGAVLETSGGSNFGAFGQTIPASKFGFAGTTLLEAGETYWVSFDTVDGPSSWLVWNFNTTGANLPRAYMNNTSGGNWVDAGTTTAGAMRIEGTVVPAPAAFALLGVAGLVSRRRRR